MLENNTVETISNQASDMKECTKCKSTKPRTEFSSWANRKTGTMSESSRCKVCVAAYSRQRYDSKKDVLRSQMKEYYEQHKEVIKANARDYYSKNKNAVILKVAKYKAANKVNVEASIKRWREANPERYKACQLEWADRNWDKVRSSSRDFANRVKARTAEKWQAMRMMVMDQYGGPVCACCGETIYSFLTLDHVHNDGAEHRRQIGKHLYRWIIENDYPEGFQVLCMNCNFGKHQNGGVCPHVHLKAQRLGETRTLQAIGGGSAQQPA